MQQQQLQLLLVVAVRSVLKNLTKIGTHTTASIGKTASTRSSSSSSSSSSSAAVSEASSSKNEITPAMIRTLYRDFMHILQIQQKQTTSKKQSQQTTHDPIQQVRDAFRHPVAVVASGTTTATSASTPETPPPPPTTTTTSDSTIEARYQHGINRFSFLRMNTIHYKPRTYNHMTSSNTTNGTERYLYKDGQRYALHASTDENNHNGTLRHNQRGYVISPYDGKNLDPQSVTRHRQSLKRAGFINNSHAKGMF